MKKYLIIAGMIISLLSTITWQHSMIKELSHDREKYRTNTETLLADVQRYQTEDSLNAAAVGLLKLKVSEYEKYRSGDLKTIEKLKIEKRDLQSVTTAQTETINELRGTVRDSIVYLPGDTVVLRCVEIHETWFDLTGCITPAGEFSGKHINRESLLIASTVQRKRFLGFLWKTRKIKNRKVDIVSKNPTTEIAEFEYIEIEE
jgi:hypothetical protein